METKIDCSGISRSTGNSFLAASNIYSTLEEDFSKSCGMFVEYGYIEDKFAALIAKEWMGVRFGRGRKSWVLNRLHSTL